MLEIDNPTELRWKRRLDASASLRRKFKAIAKWTVGLVIVAVGSFTAAFVVRIGLAIPNPLSPHVAYVSIAGAFIGGVGGFTGYYCIVNSMGKSFPKLAKRDWTESLAPKILAYALGNPCAVHCSHLSWNLFRLSLSHRSLGQRLSSLSTGTLFVPLFHRESP